MWTRPPASTLHTGQIRAILGRGGRMTMTDKELAALLERCSEELAQAAAINAGEDAGCIVFELPGAAD